MEMETDRNIRRPMRKVGKKMITLKAIDGKGSRGAYDGNGRTRTTKMDETRQQRYWIKIKKSRKRIEREKSGHN